MSTTTSEFATDDPATVRAPGYEVATVCFYCGGTVAEDANGRRVCGSCRTVWERFYCQTCPHCQGDKNEDFAFVHLHTPYQVTRDARGFTQALGVAWCDTCDSWSLYEWLRDRPAGSPPLIRLMGWPGQGMFQQRRVSARDHVHHNS